MPSAIDPAARPTPALMFQGTGSDVGKSLLVAGLGRAFTRAGLAVRPFKPQNMSNNAAVTPDGGEIGRAQALQARACGLAPTTDMNPILLKPQSERGAQIIVRGRMRGSADARAYQAMKPDLLPVALDCYRRLAQGADLLLVEGAGGAAEVNLRAGDIANMGFAIAANVPVILIGDIDRGGVIASIVGTAVLLPPADRAQLIGYVINKFRGDPTLFEPALDIIRETAGLGCFGVVPWFADAHRLPAEDAAGLDQATGRRGGGVRIAVPRLPRIANFDDFDPLAAEPGVELHMVPPGRPLPEDADLVILPGSKSTRADLAALIAEGWDIDIRAHVRRRRPVLGICAGYQMLGRTIADPDGIEGAPGVSQGLGLLDVETVMTGTKSLTAVSGAVDGVAVSGYEMHVGATTGGDRDRPYAILGDGRPDGARSADGLVAGCYLHGLFASDRFRAKLLAGLGSGAASTLAYEASVEATLDRLADHLERHIDLDRLLALARGWAEGAR